MANNTIKATVCISQEIEIPKEILDKAMGYVEKRRICIKKAVLQVLMKHLMEIEISGNITACPQDMNLIN